MFLLGFFFHIIDHLLNGSALFALKQIFSMIKASYLHGKPSKR